MNRYYVMILLFTTIVFNCKDNTIVDDLDKESSYETYEDGSMDESEDNLDHGNLDMHKEKPKSIMQQKAELEKQGYQVFEMVDEVSKDTIIMQQYFIAFLKSGPVRNQNEEEAKQLQIDHLTHLAKMYDMGYADISGPFGDDGDIRGITIYNTPTLEMADSLANSDPMVKAQRLVIEMHPWWAAKGFKLR